MSSCHMTSKPVSEKGNCNDSPTLRITSEYPVRLANDARGPVPEKDKG